MTSSLLTVTETTEETVRLLLAAALQRPIIVDDSDGSDSDGGDSDGSDSDGSDSDGSDSDADENDTSSGDHVASEVIVRQAAAPVATFGAEVEDDSAPDPAPDPAPEKRLLGAFAAYLARYERAHAGAYCDFYERMLDLQRAQAEERRANAGATPSAEEPGGATGNEGGEGATTSAFRRIGNASMDAFSKLTRGDHDARQAKRRAQAAACAQRAMRRFKRATRRLQAVRAPATAAAHEATVRAFATHARRTLAPSGWLERAVLRPNGLTGALQIDVASVAALGRALPQWPAAREGGGYAAVAAATAATATRSLRRVVDLLDTAPPQDPQDNEAPPEPPLALGRRLGLLHLAQDAWVRAPWVRAFGGGSRSGRWELAAAAALAVAAAATMFHAVATT
jgi:hypothetical protein